MSRSTRRRYQRTDLLTTTYMNLRKSGTPQFVTAHEAYRMTDGRVGTKGDHNLDHGFGLMRLVEKAEGNVKALDKSPENCDHEERMPIPGLSFEACMDCGSTFKPEPVPPLAEQGKILRDRLSAPKPTGPEQGDVVSYTKPLLTKGEAARWRVRYVDPSDGTLTLNLLGHVKRSTARFGVDPGKVTVRVHMATA